MAAIELGAAYLSIIPDVSKIAPRVQGALDGTQRQFEKSGKESGGIFSKMLGANLLSAGIVKTTEKASGLISGALNRGFNRFTGIENAKAKLTGFGHSAAAVDKIMQNALASVKGTAFGLDAAATTAAGAVAAGIKPGQELERVLKTVANSAAAAGVDMSEMGSIFNKAASTGKVQNDILAQVADRGLPIYQALAKQLGVTAEEVFKLSSKGKIGFKDFSVAMEKMTGTTAKAMGETTTGKIQNFNAALGRLGEKALKQVMPTFNKGISGMTKAVDNMGPVVEPVAAMVGRNLARGFETAGDLASAAIPKIKNYVDGISGLWTILAKGDFTGASKTLGFDEDSKFVDWLFTIREGFITTGEKAREFWQQIKDGWAFGAGIEGVADTPFTRLGEAIALVQVAWDTLKRGFLGEDIYVAPESLADKFYKLGEDARVAFDWVINAIQHIPAALQASFEWIQRNRGWLEPLVGGVLAMVAAWKAYKATMAVVQAVTKAYTAVQAALNAVMALNPIGIIVLAVVGLIAALVIAYKRNEKFRETVDRIASAIMGGFRKALSWIADTAFPALRKGWDSVSGFFSRAGDMFSNLGTSMVDGWNSAWSSLKAAWDSSVAAVSGAFNGVRDAIVGAFQSAWDWVAGVFTGLWNGLVGIFGPPLNTVNKIVSVAIGAWRYYFAAFWTWVGSTFMGWMRGLWGLIKPVLDTVSDGINTAWAAIKGWFSSGWTWISSTFMGWWRTLTGLISSVMNAVSSAVSAAWMTTRGWFSSAWNWVSTTFRAWWNTLTELVMKPVRLARDGINTVWANIKTAFSNAWTWMSSTFSKLWSGLKGVITKPVEDAKTAVVGKDGAMDKLKAGFSAAVSAIGKVWEGFKAAIQAPIKLAADVVINPMIGAFNALADKVGMGDKKLSKWTFLEGKRDGGIIPGVFSPANRDNVLGLSAAGIPTVRVEPGEHITNREATRRSTGILSAINAGRIDDQFLKYLPGLKGGGFVNPVSGRGNQHPRSQYPWANWAGDFPQPMGTPIKAWKDGIVSLVRHLTTSYGYHTRINHPDGSQSLYAHQSKILVNPGQAVKMGQIIGLVGSTGKSSGPHLHFETKNGHYAGGSGAGLPATGASNPLAGLLNGFSSGWEWLKDKVAAPFKRIKEVATGNGVFGEIISGIPGLVKDGLINYARSAFDIAKLPQKVMSGLWDKAASGAKWVWGKLTGDAYEKWRPMVARALAFTGIGGGRADENLWLKQIQTESTGNPNLIQDPRVYDINIKRGDPARGLVQVPGVTWADFGYGMGSFIPNVYDPYKNLIVGMRAANAQHKPDWRRMIGKGHGYLNGGTVGYDQLASLSEDGRPELVVGPQFRHLQAGSRVYNYDETRSLMGGTRVYVQNPWTGEYMEARMADVADDRIDDHAAAVRRREYQPA